MNTIVTNGEVNTQVCVFTSQATPIEATNTYWDTWDVRVFWNPPKMETTAYPPNYMPIAQYLFPHGQIWP